VKFQVLVCSGSFIFNLSFNFKRLEFELLLNLIVVSLMAVVRTVLINCIRVERGSFMFCSVFFEEAVVASSVVG
jgi:hypothetical protein